MHFGINTNDLANISSHFKAIALKKTTILLKLVKTDKYCDRLGFVHTGIICEFIIVGDREVTQGKRI
jgi:hypothetical protein